MTPTEKIDAALDSVLKASGSTINNYMILKSQKPMLDAMRAAMRKIMSDEYIAGSHDAHKAFKGK